MRPWPAGSLLCVGAVLSGLLGLGAGCIDVSPQEREPEGGGLDTGATDEGAGASEDEVWSGSWADAPLSGGWWVGETWETGGCVELRLQSDGVSVSDWRVKVLLDEAVTTLVYGGGGAEVVLDSEQVLAWTPYAGAEALDAGGGVAASYCAEPLARPVAFAALVAEGSPGGGEGGLPWADEPVEGELLAGDARLSWAFVGTYGYECCYALGITHGGTTPWAPSWQATLSFAGDTEPLSTTGLSVATVDEQTLVAFTGAGLAPGAVASGTLCVEQGSPLVSFSLSP